MKGGFLPLFLGENMTSMYDRWKMDVPFIGGPDDEYEKILAENQQQYEEYLNSLTPEELEEYLRMQEQTVNIAKEGIDKYKDALMELS